MRTTTVLATLLLASAACGSNTETCRTDTDCPGDQLCEAQSRRCVSPSGDMDGGAADGGSSEDPYLSECESHGDCDDQITCTLDVCQEGRCRNLADDRLCEEGICNDAVGCVPATCTEDWHCDTQLDCVVGICGGVMGPGCSQGTDVSLCGEGEVCHFLRGCMKPECSTDSECDDDIDCTRDTCMDGECANMGSYSGACPANQKCDTEAGGCVPWGDEDCGDCNDEIECTSDHCDRDTGTCKRYPRHLDCPVGQWCDPSGGCRPL